MSRRIISESTRLYTPADRVWGWIGEFTNIAAWHPRVLEGRHGYDGTQHRRELDIGAESWLIERLESHDDDAMRYHYTIVSGPFPVREAEGRLWLTADTMGSCTVNWELRVVPEREDAVAAIQDFVRAGLDKLRFALAG